MSDQGNPAGPGPAATRTRRASRTGASRRPRARATRTTASRSTASRSTASRSTAHSPTAAPTASRPALRRPTTWSGRSSTLIAAAAAGHRSIVFAAQVNNKFAMGDVVGAQESSRKAKQFAIWSAVGGLVVYAFIARCSSWPPSAPAPAPAPHELMVTMSATRTAGAAGVRGLRAPLGTAVAALAATAYVGLVDPNEPGHYPTCPFLALTGQVLPRLRLAARRACAGQRRPRSGCRAATS